MGGLTFDILPQGSLTEFPRAFYSGLLLVTVLPRGVFRVHWRPVCVLAHLLHGGDSLGFVLRKHDEILQVQGAILASLELAGGIG